MSIRELTEDHERNFLHRSACLSTESKGRVKEEESCSVRTCFQRDRDRIVHSKSFRRLKHKTQVFLAPMGDHYRTRISHALEVSQIARTISRALKLNEDLTEAIALAHDLGHTPFGHAGEAVLREIHPSGFDHYKQSLRVVDYLERNGAGLNLTYEVRNGIVKHSKGKGPIIPNNDKDKPCTMEGQVVRLSDIIAYVNHDLDDALRAEVLTEIQIPKKIIDMFGNSHSKRIDTMVKDVVFSSLKTDISEIKMSEDVLDMISELRSFLYDTVYNSEMIKVEFKKAKRILSQLYEYYLKNPDEALNNIPYEDKVDRDRLVCDFIAGMTDRFALMSYRKIFIPQQWTVY